MTRKTGIKTVSELKALVSEDEDFLRPLVQIAVQEFLEAEMNEAVGAGKGERSVERPGYRSGYDPRKLITRVGTLELRVPQDRAGRFSTEIFSRYQRSEKALVAVLVEMYVQGVSTRKVKAISEELCGYECSASTIREDLPPPWPRISAGSATRARRRAISPRSSPSTANCTAPRPETPWTASRIAPRRQSKRSRGFWTAARFGGSSPASRDPRGRSAVPVTAWKDRRGGDRKQSRKRRFNHVAGLMQRARSDPPTLPEWSVFL
jgi:hypothetical protein